MYIMGKRRGYFFYISYCTISFLNCIPNKEGRREWMIQSIINYNIILSNSIVSIIYCWQVPSFTLLIRLNVVRYYLIPININKDKGLFKTLLLTLPITSASAERTFSKLKIIKKTILNLSNSFSWSGNSINCKESQFKN